MVKACLTGAFPRSDALIEATRAYDRRRLPEGDLEEAFVKDSEAVASLQGTQGLDWITDGQLAWHDLFRPVAEALEGITLGPLTRWYDNNTFYRKPIVTARIHRRGALAPRYLRTSLLPKGRPWKAILPGPYTFARLAEDRAYGRPRDLILDFSEALAQEGAAIAAQGFSALQISEPSLATDPPGKELQATLEGVYSDLVRRIRAEVHLHTYFGDPSPILPFLLELPVASLGFDFHQVSVGALAGHDFDRALGCGCVDARNSPVESPQEIAAFGRKVQATLEPRELILCPNADLDFLPRAVAEGKLTALGQGTRQLAEAV